MQLPNHVDPVEFDDHYRLQQESWKEAIRELCLAHDISFAKFHAFEDGSNLVASVDDEYMVKIFPKFHRHQWESEWRVLGHLWRNGLSVPIPRLVSALLEGYGLRSTANFSALTERLTVLAILHRYSNLKFQLRIDGWWDRVKSIGELRKLAFPVGK